MKTIVKITLSLFLTTLMFRSASQTLTICAGQSTLLVANNTAGLSNPTYSLNPGNISSSNPSFVVTPTSSVVYTLYVTGTNSNSVVSTIPSTVSIQVNSTTFSVSSSGNFSLGCGASSVCVISIINANTYPVPGGAVSYTFLSPGSSSLLPNGTLGAVSNASISTPGTWSIAVRDNITQCTSWSTVNIILNNMPPTIGTVSVSQNPITCSTPTILLQVALNPTVQFLWMPTATSGNSVVVSSNSTSVSQSISAIYTLTATDSNNGCQSNTLITIYKNMYLPNATIAIPPLFGSCQPQVILTNASSTGIPPGTFPTSSIVVAQFWQGPASQPTLGLSTTYTAQAPGIYSMTILDNNNGCTKTATCNVSNISIAPIAAFVHTISGSQVTFSDNSVGTFTGTSYFWDFGDGNSSILQFPIHFYQVGGNHLVKFKVINGAACADSVIQSIYISGVPCAANSNFSVVPTGTSQVWNAIPAYPWNISAASWNWGDGSFSNALFSTHQYAAAGLYNICLSVTVSCVATSSSCASYSVYRVSKEAMVREIRVIAPDLVSGITSSATDNQLSWHIVPNPNNGVFSINMNSALSQSAQITIRDISGRPIHKQVAEQGSISIQVQTQNLPAGIYLVSLEIGEYKYNKRMVLNN